MVDFSVIRAALGHAHISDLKATQYAHILMTDGSGSTAEKPVGFACVGYTKTNGGWYEWAVAGALTAGTVNDAERWGVLVGIDRILRQVRSETTTRVAVISDSTYTVKCIRDRQAQWSPGWGILSDAVRLGLFVDGYHVRRAILDGNILADAAAGKFRQYIAAIVSPQPSVAAKVPHDA